MVEIDQLAGYQIESHRVDREVSTGEVGLKRARSHHRILSRGWVRLLTCHGHIQRDPIQLKRHRAEGPMLLNIGDSLGAELAG